MRFLFVLGLLGASSAWVGPAHAQGDEAPSEELDEAARLLFEEGTRAYEAGRFDEARGRFQNAYELSGRPQLLYNIASCHDRLDEREQALDFYERFLVELPDSPRAAIVASRVDVLRQSLSAGESAGGDTVGPVDSPDEATDSADSAGASDSSRSWVGPIASFSVAGAGLITFVVAGLIADSKYSSAEEECRSGMCVEADLDAVDRSALIADIGLGVAIAGAAVGVVWLLVGGKESTDSRAAVSPFVSPQHAGLAMEGSF